MAKKIDGRRSPTQSRAAFTVAAIKQAAAEVMLDVGLAKASTRAIADRAGVSVGTLYQYFANRDALVAALREDHERQVFAALQGAAADPTVGDPEQLFRQMIRANIDAHLDAPHLHRLLTVEHPHVGVTPTRGLCPLQTELNDVFDQTVRRFDALSDASAAEISPVMVGVFRLVEGLTHALVVDCPPRRALDELESIVTAAGVAYTDAAMPGVFTRTASA